MVLKQTKALEIKPQEQKTTTTEKKKKKNANNNKKKPETRETLNEKFNCAFVFASNVLLYLPPSRPLRFFLELLPLEVLLLPPPPPPLLPALPPPELLAFEEFAELLSLLFQRINILSG